MKATPVSGTFLMKAAWRRLIWPLISNVGPTPFGNRGNAEIDGRNGTELGGEGSMAGFAGITPRVRNCVRKTFQNVLNRAKSS